MSKVLITGGGGYLGFRIALEYLERTDWGLILGIHAGNAEELERKGDLLKARLGAEAGRVEVFPLELRDAQPFAALDAAQLTAIVHCAAVVRFNVEEEAAQAVNIEGTQKLLDFAQRCPRLEAFGLLSSVYASGLREGEISEQRLDGSARFANHYERSKWASEELLFERRPALPWKVFRVATVLADGDEGQVIQQNAVHNTLKLFYYGLISIIPGRPETPVYLVNGDFVAEAVLRGMQGGRPQTIFHVCHKAEHSLRLGQVVDEAFAVFSEDADFKRKRLLKPLYADAESFEALNRAMAGMGGEVLAQGLRSVAPFGAQLFVRKAVLNDSMLAVLPGYRAPDAVAQLRRACQQLVATRFRKAAVTEIRSSLREGIFV